MYAAAKLVGKARPTVKDLAAIKPESMVKAVVTESIEAVQIQYEALGASDVVAKGTQLLQVLQKDLEKVFPIRMRGS
jgi:hypothetical protein